LSLKSTKKPTILFVIGTNGVGKTTTVSKLCKLYQEQGKSFF
jgi:fused signal recognition particle receptor